MSTPQPAPQELDRWPISWYIPASASHPMRLKCIARTCTHIFTTNTSIRYRWNHWQVSKPHSRPAQSTDHFILRFLNNQRTCPYCPYNIISKNQTIRDLFQHELEEHHTSNTTNIEGIAVLVRQGLFRTSTPELEMVVWERMCQVLKTVPEYRVMLQFCHLPPYTIGENFKTLLAPERVRRGSREGPEDAVPPYYTPVPAEEFLMHLVPDRFDVWAVRLGWETHWNNLRIMYEYGLI